MKSIDDTYLIEQVYKTIHSTFYKYSLNYAVDETCITEFKLNKEVFAEHLKTYMANALAKGLSEKMSIVQERKEGIIFLSSEMYCFSDIEFHLFVKRIMDVVEEYIKLKVGGD